MQSGTEKIIFSLEDILGYRFADRELLLVALTHRSRANEVKEGLGDNQRLEFFGDSILGFLVAEELFRRFPAAREGELTKLRAAIVDEAALAKVAQSITLGDFLLLGKGEERTGGREKSSLLADGVEALIAAVYLDGGIDQVRRLFSRLFNSVLEAAREGVFQRDFKTELQELVQARFASAPCYEELSSEGPDHDRLYSFQVLVDGRICGNGSGGSKKSAQQAAAREALKALLEG